MGGAHRKGLCVGLEHELSHDLVAPENPQFESKRSCPFRRTRSRPRRFARGWLWRTRWLWGALGWDWSAGRVGKRGDDCRTGFDGRGLARRICGLRRSDLYQIGRGLAGARLDSNHGTADPNLIARANRSLVDALTVYVRALDAPHVDNRDRVNKGPVGSGDEIRVGSTVIRI